MQDCISASAESAPIIPNKRVNYAFGMVLGVKDFVQEQAHFEWKSRLSNRLPHGYGTLCGLSVQLEEIQEGGATTDFQIKIEPGYAISPKGNWLWLQDELCAMLTAWVAKNKATKPEPDAAGPDIDKNHVYIRFCYSECATDAVPIAANPCASADDNTAASRILETIAADFSWTPPMQDEVKKTADYGVLLAAEADPVKIHADLTAWATDERPTLSSNGCLPPDESEDCLLLARITFLYVTATDSIDYSTVALHTEERPVLADTRLLQEWMAALQSNAIKVGDPAGGDLSGTYPNPFVETSHGKVLIKVDDPAGGDLSGTYPNPTVATSQGNVIITEGTAAGGDLSGTYPNPTVETSHGQVIIKVDDAAGGDLSGTYPNPVVATSQGNVIITDGTAAGGDLSGTYPNPFVETSHGQALIKVGDAAGGDLSGTYPNPSVNIAAILEQIERIPRLELANIKLLSANIFQFWFHLAPARENRITLQPPTASAVEVWQETVDPASATPFLTPVKVTSAAVQGARNVWNLTVNPDHPKQFLLRFIFHLAKMPIKDESQAANPAGTLFELVKQQRVRWEGFDGEETVTLFFDASSGG